jgi:hypothetical protein
MRMIAFLSKGGLVRGALVAVAAGMFVPLGTVAALWTNPLFVRMTPAGGFAVLLALAIRLELARRECFKTDAPDSSAAT